MVLRPDTRAHLRRNTGQNELSHRFPGSATKEQPGPKSQVLVLHLFFFKVLWISDDFRVKNCSSLTLLAFTWYVGLS